LREEGDERNLRKKGLETDGEADEYKKTKGKYQKLHQKAIIPEKL
jgi:hypothetical protein